LILHTCRIQPSFLSTFLESYLHEVLPACKSSRVFEEYGTAGSLSWFTQRHVTILPDSDEKGLEYLQQKMPEGLYFSEFTIYEEIYRHARNQTREIFCRKPFFTVMVELSDKNTNSFMKWYHENYLPKTLADIPMWSACRRYRALNSDAEKQITIYEADNEADLARGFELLRKDYRYHSNEAWAQWVGETILTQDACSFRPIFHYPE
jgi:hypothetical protein